MAVFELDRLSALRERKQLVPETDAEYRQPPEQLAYHRYLAGVLARVARTVREHDPVIAPAENLLRADRVRVDGNGAAAAAELAGDVPLCAVVDERDTVFFAALCGQGMRLAAADGGDRILYRIAENVGIRCGRGGAYRSVHNARLAYYLGHAAGVDAADAGNAVAAEKFVHRSLAAEVRRLLAPLSHNIAAQCGLALLVRGDHAVVSYHREGLQHYLPVIARVGQRLDVAAHSRSEYQLADGVAIRTECASLEYLTVSEHQISLFDFLVHSSSVRVYVRITQSPGTDRIVRSDARGKKVILFRSAFRSGLFRHPRVIHKCPHASAAGRKRPPQHTAAAGHPRPAHDLSACGT